MWIWTVLTSEFFWGVIVGLVLSVFGSYWLAKFSASETRKTQKELVKAFCADTVSNLKKIVDGMSGLGGWGLSVRLGLDGICHLNQRQSLREVSRI